MEEALTAAFLAAEEEVCNLRLDTTASGTTATLVVVQVGRQSAPCVQLQLQLHGTLHRQARRVVGSHSC